MCSPTSCSCSPSLTFWHLFNIASPCLLLITFSPFWGLGQVVPAVHRDGVVPWLLLLLLHGCDDVDHALSVAGDAHFRPAMEVELPDLSALVLLWRKGGSEKQGHPGFPWGRSPPALLPWYWWPGGLSQCSSHIPLPSSAPLWCLHRTLVHLRASTGHTSPGINGTVEGAQNTMYGRSGAAPWATCPPLNTIPVTQNTLSPRCWKFSGSFLT